MEENTDKTLFNRNHSNIFKDQSPSWQKKLKAFAQQRTLNKQIHNHVTGPNNVTDKGLIFKIYQQLIQLN